MHLESQGTRTAEALETLKALERHLDTGALGNLGTRATRGTLLADSFRDSEKKIQNLGFSLI